MTQSEASNAIDTGVSRGESGQARWLAMYEQMLTIRLFEEHVNQLYHDRQNARPGSPVQRRGGHSGRRVPGIAPG